MASCAISRIRDETFGGRGTPDRIKTECDKPISLCRGCGREIYDQWILRVAPDLEWHARCLRCVNCDECLMESETCFVKDDKTYCRKDYAKMFAQRCSKCSDVFKKDDYVMRAREKVFHVGCFCCVICSKRLKPGDQFALREEGLCCKDDHEILEKETGTHHPGVGSHPYQFIPLNPLREQTTNFSPGTPEESMFLGGMVSAGGPPLMPPSMPIPPSSSDLHLLSLHSDPSNGAPFSPTTLLPLADISPSSTIPLLPPNSGTMHRSSGASSTVSSNDQSSTCLSVRDHGGDGRSLSKKEKRKEQKTTRVRTVLNEKQLHTLRTCYGANPRPDALMKEQLVEMTSLSPRVIRVWFQNKRCKDKKRQQLMKQMQQQQEKNQALNGLRIHGVGPLITPNVTQHDVAMGQALDIQQFQQNPAIWGGHPMGPGPFNPMKVEGTLENPNPFQQLIHGFGDTGIGMDSSMSYIGCAVSAAQLAGGMDGLQSISPENPSDLSSPCCSE